MIHSAKFVTLLSDYAVTMQQQVVTNACLCQEIRFACADGVLVLVVLFCTAPGGREESVAQAVTHPGMGINGETSVATSPKGFLASLKNNGQMTCDDQA